SGYIFFATRGGWVKKTPVSEFQNVRSTGIIAIKLEEGDTLVGARLTRGNDEIILVSSAGHALRFHEEDVRPMGRDTRGVKGIALGPDEYVVGMDGVVPGADLLVVSETGVGKRTPLTEYPTYRRGARGVITIQLVPERHGRLVGVKAVTEGNDPILVSEQGVLIRIPVEEVRRSGRNTQGVQLMNLDANDRVSAIAQVVNREED